MALKLDINSFFKCFSISKTAICALLLATTSFVSAQEYDFCVIGECTPEYLELAKEYGENIKPMAPEHCAIQNDCVAEAKFIETLPISKDECTMGRYNELLIHIRDVEAKFHGLIEKYPLSLQSFYPGESPVSIGLKLLLQEHFIQCEKAGLFSGDMTVCLSKDCENKLKKIQREEVTPKGCGMSGNWDISNVLAMPTPFEFEKTILKKAADIHEEACRENNFTPVARRLNLTVYKRDLPTLEAGENAEEKARQSLKNLHLTQEGCAAEVYESIKENIEAMKSGYGKLSTKNYGKEQSNIFAAELLRHFIQCEKNNLFSSVSNKCLSEECQSMMVQLSELKVDAEDCPKVNTQINAEAIRLKSEARYIENKKAERIELCENEGFLPKGKKVKKPSKQKASTNVAQESPLIDTQNALFSNAKQNTETNKVVLEEDPELTSQQANILRRLYLMDVNEARSSSTENDSLIPYPTVSQLLQSLPVNAENCDKEKVFMPIYTSLNFFENQFEKEDLPFPKELINLRKKIWQYRDKCVKAGFN